MQIDGQKDSLQPRENSLLVKAGNLSEDWLVPRGVERQVCSMYLVLRKIRCKVAVIRE